MGIQNGKFFDVSNTRDYFAQLADEYDEYSKKAVVHQKALTNFTTTESWKGADADKAKSLIKSNKITLVDEVMALQLEAIDLGENILDKFRVEVDNAVDARIEYDTLEKINDDYTIRYANYVDVSNLSYNQVASLQQRYSRYGNIRTPDYSMGQNYLIELCGGEDDASGFMFTCMQKLVKFDDEATAMVAEANIGERAEALRDRMQANNSRAGISKIFGRMVRGFDLRHMKIGSRRVISALFSGIFLKSRYGYKKGGKYSVIATPMVYKTTAKKTKTKKYKTNNTTTKGVNNGGKDMSSAATDLMVYNENTGTYAFEDLMAKSRDEGYKLTAKENAALAEVFDLYFSKFEDGSATADDIDVAQRLMKGLITVDKPDMADPCACYHYQANTQLSKGILNSLDKDSLAALTINRLTFKGECGVSVCESRGTNFDIISVKIKPDRAGIALSLEVNTDNQGKPEYTYHKGRIVSLASAKTYINNMQSENSKFGNGVPVDELARLLTSVRTKNDMNFMECLINDDDYNDAFDLTGDLSLSTQIAFADYHMYFYQTDVNGNLISKADGSPTESTQEFIKILNAALDRRSSSYVEYLYTAAELRTASTAISMSCYDESNPAWNVLLGQFNKELTLTNLYSVVGCKSDEILGATPSYFTIENIKQVSDKKQGLTISYHLKTFLPSSGLGPSVWANDETKTFSFFNYDVDTDTMVEKYEIQEAMALTEKLNDATKSDLKALAKDSISGVASFFGPEAMLVATFLNLGIDCTEKQLKTAVKGTYTNSLKIAKQTVSSQSALSGIDIASNAGSMAVDVVGDAITLYKDSVALNDRLDSESLKYKSIWFGTGAYRFVTSSNNQSGIDVFYNPTIVSPRAMHNISLWNKQGFAGMMGWDDDRVNEIIDFLKSSDDENIDNNDLQEIKLYLTGKNDNDDKLNVLKLDDYTEFNSKMNYIEIAYNATKSTDESDISITNEWRELCKPEESE